MRPKEFPKVRPVFRLSPLGWERWGSSQVTSHFAVEVEANVIGTDDVVLEKRHVWTLCYLKVTRRAATFIFEDKHSIDGSKEWMRPVRVYRDFRSDAARSGLRKLNERLSDLIAPHHRGGVHACDLGAELCRDVHAQLVVMDVLQS